MTVRIIENATKSIVVIIKAPLELLDPKIIQILDLDQEKTIDIVRVTIIFQLLTMPILAFVMKDINIKNHIKITNITLITENRPGIALIVNIPDHMIALIVITLTLIENISHFEITNTLIDCHQNLDLVEVHPIQVPDIINARQLIRLIPLDTNTNSTFEVNMYHRTPPAKFIIPSSWFLNLYTPKPANDTSTLSELEILLLLDGGASISVLKIPTTILAGKFFKVSRVPYNDPNNKTFTVAKKAEVPILVNVTRTCHTSLDDKSRASYSVSCYSVLEK